MGWWDWFLGIRCITKIEIYSLYFSFTLLVVVFMGIYRVLL
jgi:hypothetical protein